MQQVSQRVELDAGENIQLAGQLSEQSNRESRGLVVLLHGWEGCHDSIYLYNAASYLFGLGYNILRLNLRDHGFTHHLNQGIFHCGRSDEVVSAIGNAKIRFADQKPLFLVGFSLGGNFALRVARDGPARAPEHRVIPDQVISVSALLNPAHSLLALERSRWLYRPYFMRKWRRSMNAKQAAFPDIYDFGDYRSSRSFTELTELFACRLTPYGSLNDYLNSYTLRQSDIDNINVPTHLIAAADDPVIPASDYQSLQNTPQVRIHLQAAGGHCGFVDDLKQPSWVDRSIAAILNSNP